MNNVYRTMEDLSQYDYENYIAQLIGNKHSHYPAEDIAIELYQMGEFQELIKNIIYKGNIKVLSELKRQ